MLVRKDSSEEQGIIQFPTFADDDCETPRCHTQQQQQDESLRPPAIPLTEKKPFSS